MKFSWIYLGCYCAKNSIFFYKRLFFFPKVKGQRAKKTTSTKSQRPPRELESSSQSQPYFLVYLTTKISKKNSIASSFWKVYIHQPCIFLHSFITIIQYKWLLLQHSDHYQDNPCPLPIPTYLQFPQHPGTFQPQTEAILPLRNIDHINLWQKKPLPPLSFSQEIIQEPSQAKTNMKWKRTSRSCTGRHPRSIRDPATDWQAEDPVLGCSKVGSLLSGPTKHHLLAGICLLHPKGLKGYSWPTRASLDISLNSQPSSQWW